jgi:hypothetical protein
MRNFQLACAQTSAQWSTETTQLNSIIIIYFIICGVGLSPLGTASTSGLLYKPQMIDEGDCGAIGGMKIGRGNRSTRRKPLPAPLCPPQIPHEHTRARTRAAAVGSQRLTAWAMARPSWIVTFQGNLHMELVRGQKFGWRMLRTFYYVSTSNSSLLKVPLLCRNLRCEANGKA